MWEILTVEVFNEWFLSLNDAEQTDVLASIHLLEVRGPQLGRPYVDTLEGTTISNLKELRIQHQGRPYRVFFAFDPVRRAVLLCGGDKTGDKRFYKRMIPVAEREFKKHLDSSR
jgi:hypothetical protein